MKAKKGYTLVELILAISIASMISMLFIGTISIYKKYNNEVLTDYCNSSIMSFINSAKEYSKCNNCNAYVFFYISSQKMRLYKEGSQLIKTEYLPKGFKFYFIDFGSGKNYISIDRNGDTSEAGTVTFKDMFKKYHKITIRVGSSYVEIKD